MNSLIQRLLTALLAIALPFHAAFGVVMVQSMAVSGAHTHGAGSGHAFHMVHADGHAAHEGGAHPAVHAGHDHSAADSQGSPAEPPGDHCGTCTVCCTSVGLAGVALVVPPHRAFDPRIALAEQALTSVSSPRLERPPLVL